MFGFQVNRGTGNVEILVDGLIVAEMTKAQFGTFGYQAWTASKNPTTMRRVGHSYNIG